MSPGRRGVCAAPGRGPELAPAGGALWPLAGDRAIMRTESEPLAADFTRYGPGRSEPISSHKRYYMKTLSVVANWSSTGVLRCDSGHNHPRTGGLSWDHTSASWAMLHIEGTIASDGSQSNSGWKRE